MRTRGPNLELGDAEAIAISALGAIAGNHERLSRFVAETGLDVANLRAAAAAPGFLAGVLSYVMGDDGLLVDIATEIGVAPERLALAYRLITREPPP